MDPTHIEHWSQFGLAGVVIFALFTVLGVVLKAMIRHIDRIVERHEKERERWAGSFEQFGETQRSTTEKIIENNEKCSLRVEGAIRQLEHSIKEK